MQHQTCIKMLLETILILLVLSRNSDLDANHHFEEHSPYMHILHMWPSSRYAKMFDAIHTLYMYIINICFVELRAFWM